MKIFLISHFAVFNWHRNIRSALNMFYDFEHLIIMTGKALQLNHYVINYFWKCRNHRGWFNRVTIITVEWIVWVENCLEFDTANCKSDEDSSLLLSLKHVLHVISFLNLNSICCACKDSTQNTSKMQAKISTASCCWKNVKFKTTKPEMYPKGIWKILTLTKFSQTTM